LRKREKKDGRMSIPHRLACRLVDGRFGRPRTKETTMQTALDSTPIPSSPTTVARWAGRVLTAVPVLFLVFDVVIKLIGHPSVVEASERLGLPADRMGGIAMILASCLVLYIAPRTAVLGAVLLTGYLGGAVLVHLRVGDPLISHTLFPVYVGAMLWAGLYLRDVRVRGLFAAR
jgi:hypothetical protein